MTEPSNEAMERARVMLDGARYFTQREMARELDRHATALQSARAEIQEQARLLGKSAERELALRGEISILREALQRMTRAEWPNTQCYKKEAALALEQSHDEK